MKILTSIYNIFWGDLFIIPLGNGNELGISLLVIILVFSGLYFTLRTKFLPVRCMPEMLRLTMEKKPGKNNGALSGVQSLIVSTATRVGMGNMVGVVAAVSAGGAGAVFWMWVTALLSVPVLQ